MSSPYSFQTSQMKLIFDEQLNHFFPPSFPVDFGYNTDGSSSDRTGYPVIGSQDYFGQDSSTPALPINTPIAHAYMPEGGSAHENYPTLSMSSLAPQSGYPSAATGSSSPYSAFPITPESTSGNEQLFIFQAGETSEHGIGGMTLHSSATDITELGLNPQALTSDSMIKPTVATTKVRETAEKRRTTPAKFFCTICKARGGIVASFTANHNLKS
ncbi:hypothetical protein D9757_001805 [Collybiopsis confluens]|uniref:Uncharacterized protein n=1 Tax=Collybiopsis confluens TaxID=2823264 RepID=A0A8H5MF67_9AGAR|nr:hypothetical protein D9757_001805 [Collybiopsis confluens]